MVFVPLVPMFGYLFPFFYFYLSSLWDHPRLAVNSRLVSLTPCQTGFTPPCRPSADTPLAPKFIWGDKAPPQEQQPTSAGLLPRFNTLYNNDDDAIL